MCCFARSTSSLPQTSVMSDYICAVHPFPVTLYIQILGCNDSLETGGELRWLSWLMSKGAAGVIAGRPGLHGLQFEAWSQISDMPSTSGNMGEKHVQEFGPNCLTCLQLVGTWVKNMFRNLIPYFWRVIKKYMPLPCSSCMLRYAEIC